MSQNQAWKLPPAASTDIAKVEHARRKLEDSSQGFDPRGFQEVIKMLRKEQDHVQKKGVDDTNWMKRKPLSPDTIRVLDGGIERLRTVTNNEPPPEWATNRRSRRRKAAEKPTPRGKQTRSPTKKVRTTRKESGEVDVWDGWYGQQILRPFGGPAYAPPKLTPLELLQRRYNPRTSPPNPNNCPCYFGGEK